MYHRQLHNAEENDTPVDEVSVPHLIARLGSVTHVHLVGLSSRSLPLQCPTKHLEVLAAGGHHRSIVMHISRSMLSSEKLVSVIGALKGLVTSMWIYEVDCKDDGWPVVLDAIKSLQLRRLTLMTLQTGYVHDGGGIRKVYFLEKRQRVNKGFTGARGVDLLTLQHCTATMNGAKSRRSGH